MVVGRLPRHFKGTTTGWTGSFNHTHIVTTFSTHIGGWCVPHGWCEWCYRYIGGRHGHSNRLNVRRITAIHNIIVGFDVKPIRWIAQQTIDHHVRFGATPLVTVFQFAMQTKCFVFCPIVVVGRINGRIDTRQLIHVYHVFLNWTTTVAVGYNPGQAHTATGQFTRFEITN